mmetsp:Transcript_10424/g.27625  ORF Transcript_10424/g.27625 Transcript_10424/m.27625 type:complete len:91 (+) Transcript_10424:259-531(+)
MARLSPMASSVPWIRFGVPRRPRRRKNFCVPASVPALNLLALARHRSNREALDLAIAQAVSQHQVCFWMTRHLASRTIACFFGHACVVKK